VAAVTDDAASVIEEVVANKANHRHTTVHDLETLEIRTYVSEPDRGRQSRIGQEVEQDAVYANRRLIRGRCGKRLFRRRGELLERPCAHLYETGGLRRAHAAATGTAEAAARACQRVESRPLDAQKITISGQFCPPSAFASNLRRDQLC
jgi:hypothetical protein